MAIWIDNRNQLEKEIQQWSAASCVCLDTEFMRINTYFPTLALIQTCVDRHCALIDPVALGNHLVPLNAYLSNPQTLTITHSASEDLEALATIFPNGPAQLFDTQIAAAMVGLGYGLSYQKLVFLLLNVEIPKSETRSNWLQRPLSAEQLAYATQDVLYLPDAYAALIEKLDALGRRAWLLEDSQRMVERVANHEPDPQPQCAFRSVSQWSLETQARLRKLLLWRNETARTLNRPKSWVFDDEQALALAEATPASADSIIQQGQRQRRLPSAQRQELKRLVGEPITHDELVNLLPIPPPLTNRQKRQLSGLKEAVIEIAKSLELPEGLLCPRRYLETLVVQQRWPDALGGWRKSLLYPTLMSLIE